MMHHAHDPHPDDGVLHDLVDGRLADIARARAEAHVARCAACAARVARLRRLLGAVAALPRELDPERDGWPALRAALAARGAPGRAPAGPRAAAAGAGARRAWHRLGRHSPLVALVAATLLLAAVGVWGLRRHPAPTDESVGVAAAPVGSPDAATAFAAVERDYARAAAELTAQLAATRDRLPDAVAASLDRSLATIDTALVEARTALQQDPGNPDLARFVAASYEHKLDLLRRSTTITSGD